MEHLGLAISLCFASLLVRNISSRAKIKLRTRRGSPVWPMLRRRQWDEPGAGSSTSLSIEAEALPFPEWLPRVNTQAGSPPPCREKSREGLCLWDQGMLRAPLRGKKESRLRCQQNQGSLPAFRNIHTFIYLPHGFAVQQHMCCGCVMLSEKSTQIEEHCGWGRGTGWHWADGGTWGRGRQLETLICCLPKKRLHLITFVQEQETHYQHWSKVLGKL